jgi:hypothetical protein
MKIVSMILFSMYSFSTIAQTSDTLIVSRLGDLEWTKDYSNSTQFGFIKFEDGSVLKVGDKMKFGVPSGTNQSSNRSTGVASSSTNRTNNFTYLMLGRMGSAIMSGVTYLPESFKGREAVIENIKMFKSKKANVPSNGTIIFQNPGMDITVLDLKFALEFGELINPKAAMTSDEALAELKRAKDKLDLGLITQTHFDSLRNVLSKLIK